jgi:hypothetical protein
MAIHGMETRGTNYVLNATAQRAGLAGVKMEGAKWRLFLR